MLYNKCMDAKLKERILEKAKNIYEGENSGHDISHIKRVLLYSDVMRKYEGGDPDVIFVSAVFHDVHRVMSNKLKRFVSPEESIDVVRQILEEFHFDDDFLAKVLYVIANHDKKDMRKSEMSQELQIVQDADILDAIGVKGLQRTLKYCKAKHIPVSNTNYSLTTDKYIPNINPISTTHYVARTMIPQASYLHTESGKLLAKNQIVILKDFVQKNINEKNVDDYEL